MRIRSHKPRSAGAASIGTDYSVNRHRFPGLGDGWARLDGPAGTLALDSCADAVAAYLHGSDVANLAAPSAASQATQMLLARSRSVVADVLGGVPEGVVLGPSSTALIARFADAFGEELSPGDEILCSELDHDANVSPWLHVARRTGATVKLARVDPATLDLPASAIAEALTPRTRIVAMTAASNAVGTQPDLAAITDVVHASGALLFLDAVHAVPHGPADVAGCDADAVVCSAYKWFGPHVSALRVRPELLQRLHPTRIRPAPADGPQAWEQGALPFELLPGLIAAAEYVLALDWIASRHHETELLEALLTGLRQLPRVTILGSPSRRTSTVSFTVDGLSCARVAGALADRKIAVSHGNFYAVELFDRPGLHGAVRAGAVHYNDHDDIARLLDAVGRL